MSTNAILYMAGMLLVLLGERVIGGSDPTRWGLNGIGIICLLAVLVQLQRTVVAASEDRKPSTSHALKFALIGVFSLALYATTTDPVMAVFDFQSDTSEDRFLVLLGALWPLTWLCGTLPFLVVDRALRVNPVAVVHARVTEAAYGALGVALAISMLFPVNWIAQDANQRWDFGYFKTARPGTSTIALVENLTEPITAYLFFPVSSDVTDEVRTYFDQVNTGLLTIENVDHALEPELAKDLKVRNNGYVAFVKGEGDDKQVERLKIGTDFSKAKRTLRKLDTEVQGKLLKLSRGQRLAYFTVGHGEFHWKTNVEAMRRTQNLKKILRALNFKVKELGLSQGLGTEIPEDADVVFILGPQTDFLPEEIAALKAYKQSGGSFFIGLEPEGPDMAELLTELGAAYDPSQTLASDTTYLTRNRALADRVNILSNKYSTHASITTLSRNSTQLYLIVPSSGVLTEIRGVDHKVSVTVRTMPDAWADADGDLKFDRGEERKNTWTLAMAASGSADARDGEEQEFRSVVVADATWASDAALPVDPNNGNFQFLLDNTNWLARDDENTGTVNSEEDVKIQHTKKSQGWLFYGTTFLVPLGLLMAGIGRIKWRKKQGKAS